MEIQYGSDDGEILSVLSQNDRSKFSSAGGDEQVIGETSRTELGFQILTLP